MRRRLAALALALIAPFLARGDDDLARELPRIKPLEPEAALASFRVHQGFRLRPVAVEPRVTDPVAACWDEDGRLYVIEMRGYPYPEDVPSGNVRRLEDTDDDGVYDRSTIFVDGLSWPTSVVPYDGGVFIAVAPEILYAKDADGDGVAEIKRTIFRGFGTQNVQALVNGLLWGPDGWIYGVGGGNGGDIQNLTRPGDRPVSIRGRDFRFRPDGSAFEAVSGGGQFGHSFDDWGHRFTCNNSNHLRQIVLPADAAARNPAYSPPAVLTDIAVEGGAAPVFRISPPEPWRVVRTRQRAADPAFAKRLPPTELVVTGFFTSATGATIYRGTAFPPAYRGNAFIGDVGGNLVHRKLLQKDGPIERAVRADEGVEFLASTDNWFRPVNFANTPDGALLILDMYRETIEHPASIPEPIKKHLDLTSGHDRGRLYQLEPDGFKPRERPALGRATTAELVARLADPDAWWRETAQRLLIERRDPAAVALLRDLAERRPNALARAHALWTLDVLGGLRDEDLARAAKDDEPGVREQAARLIGGRAEGSEPLRPVVLALAGDDDAAVRFALALAVGGAGDAVALPALATVARRSPGDPWTRAAVLCGLNGRARAFLAALEPIDPGSDRDRAWRDEVATLIGAGGTPGDVAWLLERYAHAESDPAAARRVVASLGRGLARAGRSASLLRTGPVGAVLGPVLDRAARTARDDAADPSARAESVELLGLGEPDRVLEVVPDLLDARQPVAVQLAALRTLGRLDDPRVGPAIVARWRGLGPSLRREAAEALLARPARVAALVDGLESKAIAPADLDPARRQQLLGQADPELKKRAEAVVGDRSSDRGPVIDRYRAALPDRADAGRGRDLFRKHCATCHRAEGVGHEVGPNLATITGRTPDDLLVHILDPNREVAPIYLNYTVATTDGRVFTGLIAEETGPAVTLQRAEGVRDTIRRDQIEAMASTGLSLMPEGLEKEIDPAAMADLIAFLRSIGAAPTGR